MAAQISIQYITSAGVTTTVSYYLFADANVRSFIEFAPSGPVYENKRFTIPGVDGNLLIRSGFRGAQYALTVRYKDTPANVDSYWKSDREAFARYNCRITDGVTTWARCTLRPDSGKRITPERYGGSNVMFFDVRYVFDQEE